jgi:hypothetical protein
LAAAREGDPYALEFLSDELVVQHGQHDLDEPAPFERLRPGAAAAQWWEVRR